MVDNSAVVLLLQGRRNAEKLAYGAHDPGPGVWKRCFTAGPVIELRQCERFSESDPDATASKAAVPPRPDVVGSVDGAWQDRHTGLEGEADGSGPGRSEGAIPGSLPFDIDVDGVPCPQTSKRGADGLGIDLETTDGKRVASLHHGREDG